MTRARAISAVLASVLLGIGSLGSPPAGGGGVTAGTLRLDPANASLSSATALERVGAVVRLQPLWTLAAYAASLGTLPSAQGWTATVAGGATEAIAAGALRLTVPAAGRALYNRAGPGAVAATEVVRIEFSVVSATGAGSQTAPHLVAAVADGGGNGSCNVYAINRTAGTATGLRCGAANAVNVPSVAPPFTRDYVAAGRFVLDCERYSHNAVLGTRWREDGRVVVGSGGVTGDEGNGVARSDYYFGVDPSNNAAVGATVDIYRVVGLDLADGSTAVYSTTAPTADVALDAGVSARWTMASIASDEVEDSAGALRYRYAAAAVDPGAGSALNGANLTLTALRAEANPVGRFFRLRVVFPSDGTILQARAWGGGSVPFTVP